jgi:hypothetical protein
MWVIIVAFAALIMAPFAPAAASACASGPTAKEMCEECCAETPCCEMSRPGDRQPIQPLAPGRSGANSDLTVAVLQPAAVLLETLPTGDQDYFSARENCERHVAAPRLLNCVRLI